MAFEDIFKQLQGNDDQENISGNIANDKETAIVKDSVKSKGKSNTDTKIVNENDSVKPNTKTVTNKVSHKLNTKNEHLKVNLESNNNPNGNNEVAEYTVKTKVDINSVLESSKKLRMDQTHTRTTWLVRNDLLDRLEALWERTDRKKGFKTKAINAALQVVVEEMESRLDELEGK